jgi:hypothetical protein
VKSSILYRVGLTLGSPRAGLFSSLMGSRTGTRAPQKSCENQSTLLKGGEVKRKSKVSLICCLK